MRRSEIFLALGIALLVALGLHSGRAQVPASYRIAGTVVSAADNHPIQRASIEILPSGQRRLVQSTTSDEYGRFAFTGVAAGTYVLQGKAPGYLATSYDEHERFNTAILTGAGVDTESLVLKLRPEGSIAGAVLDESGDPVLAGNVHLFRQSHASGDSRTVSAGGASTDDLGHFEFSHLLPGTYFLAVTAHPWYAVHPGPTQPQQPFGFTDSVDPVLDVAYPTTFYPGTPDPARASPINLHGGDTYDVQLQLQPVPALAITLPLTPHGPGQPNTFPMLRTSIFGQTQVAMGMEVRQTPTEAVFVGLAPGDYFVSQASVPFNDISGATAIHLTDRASTVVATSPSGVAHVHVLLQSAHGAALPPSLRVTLRHRGGDDAIRQFADVKKNEVTFDASPGDYFFEVNDVQRPVSIRQVVSSDQVLPSNNIHLAADTNPSFTLTVVPGVHTLKGVTVKDGKPFAGVFILLVPTAEVHEIRSYFLQQSDLDGSFDIAGLAPGDYTLFAIDGGWDLDWHKDAVLSRYLSAAVSVQVPDTPDKVQTLSEPLSVQSR